MHFARDTVPLLHLALACHFVILCSSPSASSFRASMTTTPGATIVFGR